MQNLALEVGIIHHVKIHQPECADAGGGKVETDRRSQSACADAKHLGGLQALLPLEFNLRHDQVARVAGDLIVTEFDVGNACGIQNTFAHIK